MFLLVLSQLSFAETTPELSMKRGMWALNSWGLTNIAVGLPLSLSLSEPQEVAFHQMNAGWNVINVGLAMPALIKSKPVDPKLSAKIFWINAGLDILYMAGGYTLRHQGIKNNNPQHIGWGNSILLQGGFLFGFDSVMGWRMMQY